MPVCSDRATIEKLIALVRENPVLYDTTLAEYRDGQLLYSIWNSITEAMGISNMDGNAWKKKWRNLRDTYIKRKKERATKSGPAATQKKPWLFYELLKFLDDYIKPTRTESNFTDPAWSPPSQDETGSQAVTSVCGLSDDESASCMDTERSSVVSTVTEASLPPQHTPAKRARHENLAIDMALQELINDHKKNKDKEQSMADSDPDGDEAFLTSFACRMKTLPSRIKSIVRVQISQIFHNAENPDEEPLAVAPLPRTNPYPTAMYQNLLSTAPVSS